VNSGHNQQLCLGTWFGGRNISSDEMRRVYDGAAELGIAAFDTSPRYCEGRSESALGKWISASCIREIEITTKIYTHELLPALSHQKALQHARASVLRSIERLSISSATTVLIETADVALDPSWLMECIYILLNTGVISGVALNRPSWPLLMTALAASRCTGRGCFGIHTFYNSVVAESLHSEFDIYRAIGVPVAVYGILCGGVLGRGGRPHLYAQQWLAHLGLTGAMVGLDGLTKGAFTPDLMGILEPIRRESSIKTVILGATNARQLKELAAALVGDNHPNC